MNTRTCTRVLPTAVAWALILACVARAEGWQQVGWFRSDSRNVSVGDTIVRVVSALNTQHLKLTGDFAEDSALVARYYPGWNYMTDLVVYFKATPTGYRQSAFEYSNGSEREALPTDTVSAQLGAFDHAGTRKVAVPTSLESALSDTALVVATRVCQTGTDKEMAWLVVTSGPRDTLHRSAPQSLRLYTREGGVWSVQKTVELRDPVRTGPLELRDVTGDGQPDFVYRCFLESPGHFWVDVHILSRHLGFSQMLLPAVFNPGVAAGPVK